jgi:hypothetical protein
MTRHFDRDHEPFSDSTRFAEQGSTPATPAAGQRVLFAQSDGFHDLDSGGTARGPLTSTASSGTATIVTATTSITVTHGAGYTPSAQDIMLCPTNSPTNPPGWFWADTITSTQFTINVAADPGASGASFGWRIFR